MREKQRVSASVVDSLNCNESFTCLQCANCCHPKDPREVVVLYKEDILRLSRHLCMEESVFIKQYAARVQFIYHYTDGPVQCQRVVLRINPVCPFLKNKRCSIHHINPFQCRAYPYLIQIIHDSDGYASFCEKCSGLNKQSILSGSIMSYYNREQYAHELNWLAEINQPDSVVSGWLKNIKIDSLIEMSFNKSKQEYQQTVYDKII